MRADSLSSNRLLQDRAFGLRSSGPVPAPRPPGSLFLTLLAEVSRLPEPPPSPRPGQTGAVPSRWPGSQPQDWRAGCSREGLPKRTLSSRLQNRQPRGEDGPAAHFFPGAPGPAQRRTSRSCQASEPGVQTCGFRSFKSPWPWASHCRPLGLVSSAVRLSPQRVPLCCVGPAGTSVPPPAGPSLPREPAGLRAAGQGSSHRRTRPRGLREPWVRGVPRSAGLGLSLCIWLPPGHQDLPEEEELGDVQLPAVLLLVWHAGPALRKPVWVGPSARSSCSHFYQQRASCRLQVITRAYFI